MLYGDDELRLFIETNYALQSEPGRLKSRQPIHAKSIVSPFYATVAALERDLVPVA